jgi:hypothetical protein
MVFAQENFTLSGDQFTVTVFASVWWCQNALLVLVLGMSSGQASLWQQLWPSQFSRNVSLFLPTFLVSAFTQCLPVSLWLLIQDTTFAMDWIALIAAWALGLLGLLSAIFWLANRSWQNLSILATSLLAMFWAYLSSTSQIVLPTVTFTGLCFLVFREQREKILAQFIVQALAFTSFLLVVTHAFSTGLLYDRHESSLFDPVTSTETANEFLANQDNETRWADDIETAFRTIPDIENANEKERLLDFHTLFSSTLLLVEKIEPPREFVFNSDHRLYVDWINKQLKAPSISMDESAAYQIFVQQVGILWQTLDTSTPAIRVFEGGELAILNKAVLWFGDNRSSVIWRDNSNPLTWFAIDNRFRHEFVAFGNDSTAYFATVTNGQITISQLSIGGRPISVGYNAQDSAVNYADIVTLDEQQRLSWQPQQPKRIITTDANFITAKNSTSEKCRAFWVLPFWAQANCLTASSLVWIIASTIIAASVNALWMHRIQNRNWVSFSLLTLLFSWPWLAVMWLQRKAFKKQQSAPG